MEEIANKEKIPWDLSNFVQEYLTVGENIEIFAKLSKRYNTYTLNSFSSD